MKISRRGQRGATGVIIGTMAPLSDLDLLRRLVGFDSTSRNSNLPLADFLADYVDLPGVQIHRLATDDGAKVNLVIEVGPTVPGVREGLLLSGHMDVVPADEDGWESDPFTLTERDDRLVGRGACDMKGFLALATNLARESATTRLALPLVLVFTCDEEIGTLGARHFAETWPDPERLPRAAIVGEPTSLRVVGAHKGLVELRVVVKGQSAHSGYPHLGRSAIEPALGIGLALASLRQTLATERPQHGELFPEVPFVPLNIGTIRGGAASNVVPDRCVLEVTLRPLPGMDAEALVERVRAAVRQVAGESAWHLEITSESPPMRTGERAPILAVVTEATGERTVGAVSYATDAGWLQRIGLDCVILGPGDIAAAHKPNEFLPLADLVRGRTVLERIVRRCCFQAGRSGRS
jgi:acetylornithine deacetylase